MGGMENNDKQAKEICMLPSMITHAVDQTIFFMENFKTIVFDGKESSLTLGSMLWPNMIKH